jgi:predicted DNA-binding protein (UPF0251 family)
MQTNVSKADEQRPRHLSRRQPPARVPVALDELERQRLARGWNKADLADAMGVSSRAVDDLYMRASTSPATFQKLKAALQKNPPTELDVLLTGQPTEGAA